MDPKAEFYDTVIKQQPTITISSNVITTFITTYTNCFNSVTRGSNGVVNKSCNTIFFSQQKQIYLK